MGFCHEKICELFPHIYIEVFLFALVIFTANLHAVCQPQCDANSGRYRREFASRSVCQGLYTAKTLGYRLVHLVHTSTENADWLTVDNPCGRNDIGCSSRIVGLFI